MEWNGKFQLHRNKSNSIFWMITEGSGVNQYDLALRIFTEIVSLLIPVEEDHILIDALQEI